MLMNHLRKLIHMYARTVSFHLSRQVIEHVLLGEKRKKQLRIKYCYLIFYLYPKLSNSHAIYTTRINVKQNIDYCQS